MISTQTPPTFPPRLLVTVFILLANLLYPPPAVSAHMAPVTRFAGVVQSINYKNKTITFQPRADGSFLSLGWNWQTEFIADDKRVKPEGLKAGTRVKVKYISPFFGREYATKLEWSASMNPVPPLLSANGSPYH